MRFLIINLLATAMLLVGAGAASAISMQLVPTTPTGGNIGDVVSYELYLSTEGPLDITLFSVSVTYDPTVVAYRSDLSATNSYYPLYSPSGGKTIPASWLEPVPFDGNYCTPGDPLCSNAPGEWAGILPAIGGQVNIDFIANTFPGTTTGDHSELLAIVSFEMIGAGSSNGAFSFDNGGNVFSVTGTDVAGSVNLTGDAAITVIPEPTTALLVGLGLVGLGVAGRRRA